MKFLGTCPVIFDDGHGCLGTVYAKGFCRKHYDRQRIGSNMTRRINPRRYKKEIRCTYVYVSGERCNVKYFAKGFCQSHYIQSRPSYKAMHPRHSKFAPVQS